MASGGGKDEEISFFSAPTEVPHMLHVVTQSFALPPPPGSDRA